MSRCKARTCASLESTGFASEPPTQLPQRQNADAARRHIPQDDGREIKQALSEHGHDLAITERNDQDWQEGQVSGNLERVLLAFGEAPID